MKKVLFIMALPAFLASCAAPVEKTTEPQGIALTPPSKTAIGFVQLAKDLPYYVDGASVWVDDKQKHVVNFDTVRNLGEGKAVFTDRKLISHSVREHKSLDCQKQTLTHKDGHVYSEFWGKGQAVESQERSYSLSLKAGSTLGIVGQILCANFYRG